MGVRLVKVVWRCAIVVSGAQCVEMSGAQLMPESLADNWVIQVQVIDVLSLAVFFSPFIGILR